MVRRLGQQVSINWIIRDFKKKGKLLGEVEAFSLAKVHMLFRFKLEANWDATLDGGPWIIIGQLLAVEPWVLDFVPRTDVVKMPIVWLCFPSLLIEFWSMKKILGIVEEVGKLVAIDGFIDLL